jgi:putative endonuclease
MEFAAILTMNWFKKRFGSIKPRTAVVGEWGEDVAAAFLKEAGYKILGCNVRPTRHDEIDIVVQSEDTLVFVEVKTRRREDFGRPVSAVKSDKRHALNRAAAAYLRKAGYPEMYYRFDVIEVVGQPEDIQPEITHIENAFPFERRFKFPL